MTKNRQLSSFHVSSHRGFVEIRIFFTWVHHSHFNCFVVTGIVISSVRKHFWVKFGQIVAMLGCWWTRERISNMLWNYKLNYLSWIIFWTVVKRLRSKYYCFAAPLVTMLKTLEVAQNDGYIEISPYANRDFAIFSAFGHALFSACAENLSWLLSIVETFPI